jgi:hypothetical protein
MKEDDMTYEATTLRSGQSTNSQGVRLDALSVTADLPAGYLTPETLLAYCASKMRGIDKQIQDCFAKQQARNAKAAVLSELQQTLGNYKIGFKDNPRAEEDIKAAFAKAETALASDPAMAAELEKTKTAFYATMDDHWASSDEVSGWMTSVQNMQQSLNQDGELEMLQMQSMTSQRKQAIQLCTNMIQSLGQTSQAICSNIGK